MLCILYVIAVSTLLGITGLIVERVLPARFPRRWVWCVIIPLSAFLPGYYRAHHTVSVVDVLGQQSVGGSLGHALGIASLGPLDPAWWARAQSYDTIINPLWLTASALLVIWGLANVWRVSHLVSVSRRRRGDPGKPTIVDGVPVVVTDSMGPATVGLLRSSVLVPRWVLALPGIQRRYVLRHEEEHRTAHDAHLLFGASLFLVLMPWNLALWWLLRRLSLAVEMDCDNRVVNRLGDATAYGELLLKVAQAASRGPRLQPAFLGIGMLERRLTVLLAPSPLRRAQRFMLAALVCGLLLLVFSMPHPVLEPESHAHVAMNQTHQR
jgi:bla regulator protein BlaR1